MKTRLLVLAMMAAGSMFGATRFFVGVGVRGYWPAPAPVAVYAPPPAPLVAYAPPAPGYGYTWVGGYWYPAGARYSWRPGYWARPPYARTYWVAPRYYGRRYYPGYWR
ncbi:MAG TPA: YXWGXW repeat-containing protein [Bryobacteraceae bacterium]|nr:YXWGXW repeat-containing protein [Bryobacteraceae bacterium]